MCGASFAPSPASPAAAASQPACRPIASYTNTFVEVSAIAATSSAASRTDTAVYLAGEPKPGSRARKDAEPTLQDVNQFVEFFIAAGKKGIAVNRYKGLGEMNPDTLWATTMNPENRTLLQVRAEDHAEADQMFTTLMGDQVEPRRKFIEDNALDVRNLDV